MVYASAVTPLTRGAGPGVVIGVSAPYDVNVRAPSCERIAPPQLEPLAQYAIVAASARSTKMLISNVTFEPLIDTFETRRTVDEPWVRTVNAEVDGTEVVSSASLNVSVTASPTIVPLTNVSGVVCAEPE